MSVKQSEDSIHLTFYKYGNHEKNQHTPSLGALTLHAQGTGEAIYAMGSGDQWRPVWRRHTGSDQSLPSLQAKSLIRLLRPAPSGCCHFRSRDGRL